MCHKKFVSKDEREEQDFIANQRRQLGYLSSIAMKMRGPKDKYKIDLAVSTNQKENTPKSMDLSLINGSSYSDEEISNSVSLDEKNQEVLMSVDR
jgi:hypothetical protein